MKLALMLVCAYLLGSIPSGLWLGRYVYHKDIRTLGSGNIGTTNTFRVLGKKAGLIVLFMDMFKGTLAAALPYFFGSFSHPYYSPILIGLAAVVGHGFSIFDHFHGGKAVATSAGMVLAYNPLFFLLCWLVFGSLVYFTRMVSVASTLGMVIIFGLSFFFHDPLLSSVAFILMCFIIYMHRDNFKRIRNGTENKVPFGFGYHKNSSK
ncbi:glycerol-3-phosphate 1-O-acyltransferase PlsY [Loigolactobacillus coryniformis]|uniref:Glycerol-3-phosphate acyltransferase n=3 Tax=Loigolactobacillus coryniformis TaxID=1610 RepID=A0A5B8TIK3_9LACO|nr:glycerol-3-phosphate 1-O-acyltransferase PlsY [Loigolactobacillus coryniformis]RRG06606.1 MAG: glycerol-3-phosphate 1-O-acyltransferase [Lactobacillus sp.]